MPLTLLIYGIIIGLMASIPLGPVGVLCVQRTLSKNQTSGFVSGMGAAVADTIYAILALFFISYVMGFIESNMTIMKAIGGLLVIIVGGAIFFSNPVQQMRRNRAGKTNLWKDFITVFVLTISNPALVLVFIALFAAFGLNGEALGDRKGLIVIAGVTAGATLWWFSLSFIVNFFRRRLRPRHLLWINRISGALIMGLGAAVVLSCFVKIPVNGII